MRIRSTGVDQYGTSYCYGYYCTIGTTVPLGNASWYTGQQWSYFSVFADEGGPPRRTSIDKRTKLKLPKACQREQYWLIDNPYLGWRDWNDVFMTQGKVPVPQEHVRTVLPLVSNDLLAQMGRRAWVSMSTDIDSSVSIANFLYELRDIRSLVEHLPNLLRGFTQVAKSNGFKGGSPLELMTFLRKTVSDGHLQWSFGIKPLIGDLEKLQNTTRDLYRRFKWLEDTFGKPTTIHYQENVPWNPSGGVYPIAGWSNDAISGTTSRLRVGTYKGVFRAQALLYHKVKPPAGAANFFRVYAKKLGLDNPTKIVWNALPFSFVFDWFVNTSELLDSLTEERALDGIWTLGAPMCSLTEEADIHIDFQGRSFYDASWRKSGEVRMRRYRRIVGIPIVPVQAELTGATPGQQLLGLSLLSSLSKH